MVGFDGVTYPSVSNEPPPGTSALSRGVSMVTVTGMSRISFRDVSALGQGFQNDVAELGPVAFDVQAEAGTGREREGRRRRHVGWGTNLHPRPGKLSVGVEKLRYPESGDERCALFIEQDVARLEVAVRDVPAVD